MDPEIRKEIISLSEDKEHSESHADLIKKALSWVEEKDPKDGKRLLEICKNLSEIKLKGVPFIAGILAGYSKEEDIPEIKKIFGTGVGSLVAEAKRISEMVAKSKEKNDFTREAILSSAENIESIMIDLVLNLSEIRYSTDRALARRTMEDYVPIANRLGFERLKNKLADYSFRLINPKKYKEIYDFLDMSRNERSAYIKGVIKDIGNALRGKIGKFEIKGREKQIYSIYEKMAKRKVPLDKQKDQFGIRIITNSVEDCYKTFEVLNEKYPSYDETVKDYIKNPKDNGYQSLHFYIKKDRKNIEIQVRTKEMDELAEEGAASHWAYKKMKGDVKFEKKTAWYKELLKLKGKKSSVLEGLKIGLFKDKIYCYTPKGKMIQLPLGSTALDFAYSIHAQIGNTSVGAKVNGKFVALKTELNNGDSVEVMTNKFQRPRRDWLKFVKTKYAKKIIAKEIKRFENIPVPNIKNAVEKEDKEIEAPAYIPDFPKHIVSSAKCCNPMPGDEIIGILRSYKRAIIHKKSCDRIGNTKKNEVKAEWREVFEKPVKIFVGTSDRSGILADIINTISRKGFKIKEANGKLTGNNTAECYFVVSVETLEDLQEVVKRIQKIKDVKRIWFD